jgi:hypothetical protein
MMPVPATGSLTIGGGPDDDLVLPGRHPALIQLTIVDGVPVCTTTRDVQHGSGLLPAGISRSLQPNDTLTVGEREFTMGLLGGESGFETVPAPSVDLPTQVALTFRPRGGSLRVTLAATTHEVRLSERRTDFVAVLLQPPKGYRPGGFVPDAVLFPRVWGASGGSRNSVNVLINRLRGDLNSAGMPGPVLVERFGGGSATRFALHPNASVQVG